MASSEPGVQEDKYRSHMYGEGEKNTVWKNGAPPNFDAIDKLFEEGRTQEWAVGSLEEQVQRMLKTWELELAYKVRPQDYKTINAEKYRHSVNGTPGKTLAEVQEIGGYNQFLRTSLPENLRAYDPSLYTADSSTSAFIAAFPRGFAIEIFEVYSGPPKIVYKFRHWAYMEGPFQGHAPTGELVEFFGISIFSIDESMKIEKVEFFYDPNELIAQLIKGPSDAPKLSASDCPFLSKS